MKKKLSIITLIILTCCVYRLNAQSTLQPVSDSSKNTKIIQIVSARSLRQLTINDSTILETLAGNAHIKQGNTILKGDSIVLNKRLGIAEVFGNVHINDADTVNTYAQYLKYIGNEQVAYLKKKVKLTDGKAQLFTEDLIYDIKSGIASYKGGGKVINSKTTLTSEDAVYYSDTKDVIFRNNVKLNDPKYKMNADSLRYNTEFKSAYFISPTHIVSNNGIIDTKSGTYNLETGEALFFEKPVFKDSTRFISGNKVAINEKSNVIQIEGNGKFVDSSNKVIVLGNQILIDKKNSTFLATRKPVMILYSDNDSTYISADTLFSGKTIKSSHQDSLKNDTLKSIKKANIKTAKTDSISYFIGFHHVKIFNDSLQAVCDSLHYSTEDSTFKLLQQPVCWNNNSQIKGDTMLLFTAHQKAKELQVFNNAIVINKTKEGFFNQVAGRILQGYFIKGNFDHAYIKGSPAESIFYPQDDDSAYVGMNYSKSDRIDIYFVDNALDKVKFLNDVSGTMYPIKQIPSDKKELKGFEWLDSRRPKNKLELFE